MSFHQTQCRHYCTYIKALISARDLPDVEVHILTLLCLHVAVSVHYDSSHHQKVDIHVCIFAPLLVFWVRLLQSGSLAVGSGCSSTIRREISGFLIHIVVTSLTWGHNQKPRPKTKTNLKVIGWYEYWQDLYMIEVDSSHAPIASVIIPLQWTHPPFVQEAWQAVADLYSTQSLSQQLLPKGTRCGMGISPR